MVDETTDSADRQVIAALQPLSDQLRRRERRDVVARLFAAVALFLLLVNACEGRMSRQRIESCTTAGPRTPTTADPRTGHACYDEGVQRTAAAVGSIVDADGNGKADVQELRDDLRALVTGRPLPTTTTTTTAPAH